MRRLANKVEKAKAFIVHLGKPVTFASKCQKIAKKEQGSICFFVTKEKQLKFDWQKVIDGHNQSICIKTAGA